MNKSNTIQQFLFRGKDIETGQWVEGSLFDHKGHYPEIITIRPDDDGKAVYDRICVVPETVCIWTGIEDCNGRKVFSSDIIIVRICRYKNDDGTEGWETEYQTTVGDMSSAFSVDLPEDCGYDFDVTSIMWLHEHAYAEHEIEVIGNTIDNTNHENRYA